MKNIMTRLVLIVTRTVILAMLCAISLAYGQAAPADSPLPSLNPQEFDALVKEIQTMVKTGEGAVEAFAVHEATPERIDRLYQMPEFLQQPKIIRENGLIFAGQGSLLTFTKPSDVINKISAWFPQELAAAEQAGQKNGFYLIKQHINLFGPYPSWKEEQTAFLVLWECMPVNVWRHPNLNPFLLPPNQDGFTAIADMGSGMFDFNKCVHERSGYQPSFTEAEVAVHNKIALDIGNKAAPVLQHKFAQFLSVNRCKGTGPDDCVLLLNFWGSLAPADVELAKMIQDLESEVSASAPLSALTNDDTYARGKPDFENVLRQAAFLRLKQASLEHAPTAWVAQTQQVLLQQMSHLLRYDKYLGFDMGKAARAQQSAFLAELERLLKDSSCPTIDAFLNGKPGLRSTFALHHLQDSKPNCFIGPDWDWFKKGESEEARDLRGRYLSLLGHQESGAVHELLLEFLTDNGKACFDNTGAPSQDWLKDVCNNWVSEPQTTPFELQHSHLTLDKESRFQATPLQLPPQVPLNMDAWLSKLVDGMADSEKQKMQALIAELHRLKGSVNNDDASWWKHPRHGKSLVYLKLSINAQDLLPRWPYAGWHFFPYEGSRLFLVFDAESFQIVGVPGRIHGADIVHVSDLDADGNLEVWLANASDFYRCQNDDSDLGRDLNCIAKTAEMGEIWGNTLSHFANTPKTKKQPSSVKTQSRNAALIAFAGPEPAKSPSDGQVCNVQLVSRVLRNKLAIDYGGGGPNGERGDIMNMVCKTHPVNPEQTIVALFYDFPDQSDQNIDESKGFALAVIDLKQNKVISLYQDKIEEDASIRVFDRDLWIDTAHYNLAPGVRAFGVRMDIGYTPRCGEAGESDYLSLFVEEQNSLRPVLKNFAMSSWEVSEGNFSCGYGDSDASYTTNTINRTLELADTSTNGWRDLQVVEHHHQFDSTKPATGESSTLLKVSKRLGVKLRLNGKMYSGQLP
jgi:hypothetical protein